MEVEWLYALCGGVLIGLAAALMLWTSGRIMGISGILFGLLGPTKGEMSWRLSFLGGVLTGGIGLRFFYPVAWSGAIDTQNWTLIFAGLLVGFGTVLGGGCTSGHGVCGISRLSPRSLVATCFFISAGALSVLLFKYLGALP